MLLHTGPTKHTYHDAEIKQTVFILRFQTCKVAAVRQVDNPPKFRLVKLPDDEISEASEFGHALPEKVRTLLLTHVDDKAGQALDPVQICHAAPFSVESFEAVLIYHGCGGSSSSKGVHGVRCEMRQCGA